LEHAERHALLGDEREAATLLVEKADSTRGVTCGSEDLVQHMLHDLMQRHVAARRLRDREERLKVAALRGDLLLCFGVPGLKLRDTPAQLSDLSTVALTRQCIAHHISGRLQPARQLVLVSIFFAAHNEFTRSPQGGSGTRPRPAFWHKAGSAVS